MTASALTCEQAAAMDADEILTSLDVDVGRGLSSGFEVRRRRQVHGWNNVEMAAPDPLWKKYLDQFNNPLIYLLLASAAVSVLMRQLDDAISITTAVIIVITVGFVQEYRSEKTLQRLGALLPPFCNVLRDANVQHVLAKHLVPGDVVHLGLGDRVPADVRLIQVNELTVDESSLTGEPVPKSKHSEKQHGINDINDMHNICFQGTLVTDGKAVGVVVETGENSQFGGIFKKMQSEDTPRSPLQKSMDVLGKQLSAYSLTVIGLIMVMGCWQGRPVLDMFNVGVSLAVAAIPEGLPVVVTVTLAFGVMRMAKRNAIIKRLPTVEALGCVDVICSDKTGTLTLNDMTVDCVITAGTMLLSELEPDDEKGNNIDLAALLEVAVVCNNNGSAMEKALLRLGQSKGFMPDDYLRKAEIPFNSQRKYMVVQCQRHHDGGTDIMMYFVKGALEEVLSRCRFILRHGKAVEMVEELYRSVLRQGAELGAKGLRVLAMARGANKESMEFVGLVGIRDPLRPGVKDSIRTLKSSGVQVCMITGDGKETANEIARNLGLLGNMLSGTEVDAMTDTELDNMADSVCVYYRSNPLHKLRIVKALQRIGHVVGMTGDGVNDGVAMKSADVGISMGINGTDVCKEAADVILLDDDFSTILSAIEEGKCIFYNIRNFVRFQLSTSIAALMLISISTLLDISNPLNPMQILWINVIMDGPPAQSLGLEPVDRSVLKKPPRKPGEPILTRSLMVNILISSLIITTGTMWVLRSTMQDDGIITARDTTMTFSCFVFFDMFNALSSRSQDRSIIFQVGILSNPFFCLAVGLSVVGQLLVIYFPPLQYIFQTEPLSLSDLIFLTVLSSSVFVVSEIKKLAEQKVWPSMKVGQQLLDSHLSQRESKEPIHMV